MSTIHLDDRDRRYHKHIRHPRIHSSSRYSSRRYSSPRHSSHTHNDHSSRIHSSRTKDPYIPTGATRTAYIPTALFKDPWILAGKKFTIPILGIIQNEINDDDKQYVHKHIIQRNFRNEKVFKEYYKDINKSEALYNNHFHKALIAMVGKKFIMYANAMITKGQKYDKIKRMLHSLYRYKNNLANKSGLISKQTMAQQVVAPKQQVVAPKQQVVAQQVVPKSFVVKSPFIATLDEKEEECDSDYNPTAELEEKEEEVVGHILFPYQITFDQDGNRIEQNFLIDPAWKRKDKSAGRKKIKNKSGDRRKCKRKYKGKYDQ